MKTIGLIAAVAAFATTPFAHAFADTPAATLLYLDQKGWEQAGKEAKSALAADFMRVFCGNPAMPPADLVGCLDRTREAGPVFTRAMACIATAPTGR